MLNAVEPGTVVPIHRHPTKDESFVILRGKVRVTTHNDDGSIIEEVVLSQESGNYGVDIPKNVWHKLESLESGCVTANRMASDLLKIEKQVRDKNTHEDGRALVFSLFGDKEEIYLTEKSTKKKCLVFKYPSLKMKLS